MLAAGMRISFKGDPLRILDFDIEARPLSWYGGDWVSKEVTAIAWKFVGERYAVRCLCLGQVGGGLDDLESILRNFREAYDKADMVTGHFIRGYDLPTINGALIELGMPPLGEKLSHDTKLDMIRRSGASNSQENLGAELGLTHQKVHMTQADWREANRLTKAGIAKTKKRVTGDVLQHIEMRQVMLDRGLLGRPRLWTPTPAGRGKYHA